MSTLFSRDRQLVFTPYLHRVIKLSRSDQTQFAHVIASARPVLIFFSSLKEHKRINGHSPVRRILIMRWSTRVRGVYLFRLWPAPSPSDRPSDRASDRNDLSGVRVSLVRYTAAQQVPFFFLFSFFGPTFYDDRKKNKMDIRDLFFLFLLGQIEEDGGRGR